MSAPSMYDGPHEVLPSGLCRHRWANRTTHDVRCAYVLGYRAATDGLDVAALRDAMIAYGMPTGIVTTLESERRAIFATHAEGIATRYAEIKSEARGDTP